MTLVRIIATQMLSRIVMVQRYCVVAFIYIYGEAGWRFGDITGDVSLGMIGNYVCMVTLVYGDPGNYINITWWM